MAEFSELIKNFDKIRDFMRDFYIYGFKSRSDFSIKSARTYDNEKRRCESYLGENFKWTYSGGSKVSFVSTDCGKIPANPLFNAWKSKSFTLNDIMLHFYILDSLQNSAKTSEQLTEEISFKSGKAFDLQTVRGKCNEYTGLGMFIKEKKGKAYLYKLSNSLVEFDDELIDSVKFFQGGALGIIGQFILDNNLKDNDLFIFKHHYIAHTLEDGVLFDILSAINEKKETEIELIGSKSGKALKSKIYPLKILCSFWGGRRYLCAYIPGTQRFYSFRLDTIKSVKVSDSVDNYDVFQNELLHNLDKTWGVSFNGESRNEKGFSMTLHIDEEHEKYIINRINKEGRGGILEHIGDNTFKFTKDVFDAGEAMPWVKTFIGRIISFQASKMLEERLNTDILRMAKMYGIGGLK